MPLPRKKKEEATEPTTPDLPGDVLTKEQLSVLNWKTHCLVKAGFDTWHATRIAGIQHREWREAVALKTKGATQAVIYELLR